MLHFSMTTPMISLRSGLRCLLMYSRPRSSLSDWASATHFACILDLAGSKLAERSFAHSGEGLQDLVIWIRRTAGTDPGRIAVGIEVPHGPVVESLMDAGFLVHALNPKQLDRFRDR